ncbi:MAG: hypothetical protein HOP02_15520 [Methylococcaceae bacterium]|nr:hypothetical protein [Methylococcaceae bacterium]
MSKIIIAQPQTLPSTAVATCDFIDTVEGSSGYGKNNDWKSIAKAVVLKRALKIMETER